MSQFKLSHPAPIAALVAAVILSSAVVFAGPLSGLVSGGGAVATDRRPVTPVHMRGHGGPGGQRASRAGWTDHVEGRIAFLKAELKITDAQAAQWAPVAQAMRNQAATMGALRAQIEAAPQTTEGDRALTVPEVLARREQAAEARVTALTARAAGQKQFASAFTALYDRFDDDQKKAADGLFVQRGHGRGARH